MLERPAARSGDWSGSAQRLPTCREGEPGKCRDQLHSPLTFYSWLETAGSQKHRDLLNAVAELTLLEARAAKPAWKGEWRIVYRGYRKQIRQNIKVVETG